MMGRFIFGLLNHKNSHNMHTKKSMDIMHVVLHPVPMNAEGIPVESFVEEIFVLKIAKEIHVPMNAEGIPVERDVEEIFVLKVAKEIPVLKVAKEIPVEWDVMAQIVLINATLQNAEKRVKGIHVPHIVTATIAGKIV